MDPRIGTFKIQLTRKAYVDGDFDYEDIDVPVKEVDLNFADFGLYTSYPDDTRGIFTVDDMSQM